MKKISKTQAIDTVRMKDIILQLTDVIYLLCDAKEKDTITVLTQFTNITPAERELLHMIFPQDDTQKSNKSSFPNNHW